MRDGQILDNQTSDGPTDVRENESAILKLKPFVIAVAVLLFFLAAMVITSTYPVAMSGHVDFRHLYTAGYMVRTSQGTLLYDHQANEEIQNRLVSPAPGGLTFNHLAYEALLFAPFSYLTYRPAYFLFFLVNLLVLAGTVRMLWPYFSPLAAIWKLLPASVIVCFLPVAFALAEGQDSLVLLALIVGSMVAIDRKREFLAGALVGLTLFKFQYALPVALLFLAWRRWQFVGGFASCGSLVSVSSLWVTGVSGMKKYFPYLSSISAHYSASEGVRHGIHPEGMANIRGLISAMAGDTGALTTAAILLASAVAMVWAAFKCSSIPGALLAAVLVSYHHVIADASLLVLPLGILLSFCAAPSRSRQLSSLVAGATFLAVPVLLFAGSHFYLLSVLLILLFVVWDGTYSSPQKGRDPLACPQKDTK